MARLDNKIKIELVGTNKSIEDLDIAVELKKTNEVTPNYCTVTIYNLSDDTNNLIKDTCTGARVYIAQGETANYELVFEGNLRELKKFKKPSKSKSKYTKTGKLRKKSKSTVAPKFNSPSVTTEFDDTDVKTVLELQDGRKVALFEQFFSKSYKGTFTNQQVIRDVLNSMRSNGVPIGKVDTVNTIIYKNGKTYHGPIVNELSKLIASGGGKFYIQNGVVSITGPNSTPKPYGIVLDGTNCARPEEESNKEIKVETALFPTLNPNDWVMMNFVNISGAHKIYKIESKFDNFGEANGSELVVKES